MKKIFKVAGFALMGLIGIFLIALVIINSYRKEILEEINQELGEEINGDINIGKLRITIFRDFPNVSLSLRDIYMRGPRYAEFHQDFLRAEIIDINVEALKLFRKEISIQSVDVVNGEVFIFKTQSGYTNLDIFRRTGKKDTISESQSDKVNFRNINLKNVTVSFHDSLKRKEFDAHFLDVTNTIIPGDSSTLFHVQGNVRFIGLMFNAEKGSYLKNTEAGVDFNVEFFPRARQLIVKPSSLKLTGSDIKLSGFFHLADPSAFQLNIQADSLSYKEGLSVVTESLSSKLEKYTMEKKLNVNVTIGSSLVPGSKASVDMTFSMRNNKVSSGKIEMNPLTLSGSLTNHDDRNSSPEDRNILLRFDTLYGKINGFGFGANVSVHDFEDPNLSMKAKFDISLKDLNADTISEIKFKQGRFISNFTYKGKLEEFLDTKRHKYEGKLSGVASLTGGEVEYVTKQMKFEKVEALVHFNNEQCRIENISLMMNKNPIAIKGLFTGFVPFFTQPDKRVKVVLTVTSSRLDMAKMVAQKKAKKLSEEKAAKKKRNISDLIDQLYKKLEAEITFDIKQLVNKNFKGENVTGKILLVNDRLQIKDVRMNLAGGQVDFSASLSQLQRKVNPITITAKVKNADVRDFFYSFNNFNQTTILHDNLSGKVNADIKLKASINDDLEIMTPTMDGDVEFKLTQGRLLEFEPLQKVSNFLFKNRDLSDVQFGEINAHFYLKGTELDVSRMEVQSTIFTLYVEGRYSLVDSTDLSIQVPLNNLKTRNQHIPPENIGIDKRVGASVFLRAHKGKEGTTVVTYDPFMRFKKKKNAKRVARRQEEVWSQPF